MKKAVLGALAGAGLVMAVIVALAPRDVVFAQRPMPDFQAGGDRGLIPLPGPSNEQGQLFPVFDPQRRVMSVYHVDGTTGQITLKAVRNIHWDLQMTYLNNKSPLPQEIRSLLEQRPDR